MMNGSDRRTAAACPCPVARDSLYTPVRVAELDLDEPSELRSPGGLGPVDPDGRVLALVRLHGHPLGLVKATGAPGDTAGLRRALVDAAHRELYIPSKSSAAPGALPGRVGSGRASAEPPTVSVIVCTRNREGMLRQCLDSLLRTGYPHVEVLVVDNAPSDDATEALVRARYLDQVRYLREPVAGLARARNAGLAAARGEICAFTDDDALVDAGWVSALVDAFQADGRVGCVTGLVLPAELDTEAQAGFEQYGGYSKGFTARSWSLSDRADDPLLPFSVGKFGTGASMAFRTELLRSLGGFDTATGAGTRSRGGEDLLAFFQVLTGGHTVAYQPEAIAWHRHRRTMDALTAQIYGFGVGFGAYLAAAVTHEPAQLAGLVRRLPRGLWQWQTVRRGRAHVACDGGNSQLRLGRKEFQGLLYGPFIYLFSVWQQRNAQAESRP
ncbi:glycosyltransferase [Kitasatospora sp. MAP5-34]|uniref:glycosyltransferase n=1 Tax=Kitasatospora sp. MAP5-34 TaxID=3035102 RepID=UPI002472EA2B|nr:glycosyltransferase [Kitasatospora sp. MAP5-34]MDH6575135.1 glycosyltransferase involved in cell wall biosynthesis [Kitasatospora sp. MAP5-34]